MMVLFVSILEYTLTHNNYRTLDLKSLEAAVAERFWEKEFYCDGGKFVAGSPLFPALGSFSRSQSQFTIEEILNDIADRLSPKALNLLRDLLQTQYWAEEWQLGEETEWKELQEAGLIKHHDFYDVGMHPVLKYAYRYDTYRQRLLGEDGSRKSES